MSEISDYAKSAADAMVKRVVSPITAGFIFAWAVFNHKFLLVAFSSSSFLVKISYISNEIFPDFGTILVWGFLLPFFSSLTYLFIHPAMNAGLIWWHEKFRNFITETMNEKVVSAEVHLAEISSHRLESDSLRADLANVHNENRTQRNELEAKGRENSELKEKILSLTTDSELLAAIAEGDEVQPNENELKDKISGNRFLLYFNIRGNPSAAHELEFLESKEIGVGKDRTHSFWNVENNLLTIIKDDGSVHCSFFYLRNFGIFSKASVEGEDGKESQLLIRKPTGVN